MEKFTKEGLEPSYNLKELAKFFGFKSTDKLRQKVKSGEIVGYKAGRQWMVRASKAYEYTECLEAKQQVIREVKCQLAKRKVAPTIIRDSAYAESEYKSLRKQLLERKRKNTKKSVEEI